MVAERSWTVWSCEAHLLLAESEDPVVEAASRLAHDRLREIGDACDRFRADSEVSRLRGGVATAVSPTLQHLVRAAVDVARRTDGRCDPTLGTAVRALGYDRDIRLVLDDDRPTRVVVRPRRTWESIRLEGGLLTVPEGVELDLGATAKAFAADVIAAEVSERFGCGVLMNLGGDMATAGLGPKDGWQVLVRDVPADPAAQVTLHDGFALATSSTQRRTWSRGGQRLHHIVDPATNRPAEPVWRTVSVVARTAVDANGAATGAIVAAQQAESFLSDLGLPARLVDRDGAVRVVNGWPAELAVVA